jgi:hypothetical protein
MSAVRDPGPCAVHVRYTKWDGTLHWHFDAEVIERDVHGTWVVVRPGGWYRRASDPPRVSTHGFVVLVPPGQWWTAYFNAVPHGVNAHVVYVDVNTPAVWNDLTVEMIDLDLDVVLDAGGAAEVLDEDEFLEHSRRFGYTDDVIARSRSTAAHLHGALEAGAEPFGLAGAQRVADALGWVRGRLVDGHGVASGTSGDPRFPNGTLAEQFPHFVAAGIPVEGLYRGTLNLDLFLALQPIEPRWSVQHLTWLADYPAETFAFFEARIEVRGEVHPALVYRPDPTTKPEFHQPTTVLEVLTTFLPDLQPGIPASVWVDPRQAHFVTA